MEPENIKVQASETSVAVPDMEVPKRDATDESSHPSVEEHPAKKARLDEPSKPARVDMRDRGIAPVKAEYVCLSLIYREILTFAYLGIASKSRRSLALQMRLAPTMPLKPLPMMTAMVARRTKERRRRTRARTQIAAMVHLKMRRAFAAQECLRTSLPLESANMARSADLSTICVFI
jgi:hypothetical protein